MGLFKFVFWRACTARASNREIDNFINVISLLLTAETESRVSAVQYDAKVLHLCNVGHLYFTLHENPIQVCGSLATASQQPELF